MKRKILANVLTLCMLFSMIPMTAFAVDTAPNVIAAPLGENTEANDAGNYADDTYGATINGTTITVTATNVKRHASTNPEQGRGHYIGVGIIVEGTNVKYAQGWGDASDAQYEIDAPDGTVEYMGKTYSTFYFNMDNSDSKNGYIGVQINGGTPTVYTVDVSHVTLADPTLEAVGFATKVDDVAAGMDAALKEILGREVHEDKNNIDTKTMYAIFAGANKGDTYKLKVTHQAPGASATPTDVVLSSASTTAGKTGPNTDLVQESYSSATNVFWTFETEHNGTAGTVTKDPIAEGTYSIQLQKKNGSSYDDLGEAKTIEIGKVTVKKDNTAANDKTGYFDVKAGQKVSDVITVEEPAAEAGKAFVGWVKTGTETPVLTTEQLNNTTLSESATYEAKVEEVNAAAITVTAFNGDIVGFNKAGSALQTNLVPTPATPAANGTVTFAGDSNYTFNWTEFSSNTDEQNGNFLAIKLAPADGIIAGKTISVDGTELDEDGIYIVILDGSKNYKSNVTVTVGDGQDAQTATYTLDFTGVNRKTPVVNTVAATSGEITATYRNGTVYLSGPVTFAPEATTATVPLTVTFAGPVEKSATATITKGANDALSVANVTVNTATLTFDTTGLYIVNPESTAQPAVADPEVTPPVFDDRDKQSAATAVADAISGGANTEVEQAVLTNVAAQIANNTTTAPGNALNTTQKSELAAVTEAGPNLAKIQAAVADGTDEEFVAQGVKLVVNVYTEIAITDIEPGEGGTIPTTLTLSITPRAQTVLTTADPGNEPINILSERATNKDVANAVVVSDELASISTPTVVTIDLPATYTDGEYVVEHIKNSTSYFYTGTVDTKVLTFTSLHGFSDFVIYAENPCVAKIDDTLYKTLAEAIAAAENGDTIELTANCTGEAATATVTLTADKNVTFSGQNVTLTINGTEYPVVTGGTTVTLPRTTGGDTPGGSTGGGGVSSNVTIDRPTNGKVTVTPTAPSKGATVTINLTPDTGYAVGTVTVTDKDGKAVELTKVDDTHYTFVMPDGKVTVKATFTKVDAPANGFTDVPADAYYADAVKWAVDKGITNGLTATTFGPNNSCTRGQMVTFLWRAAGSPAATGTNSFTDVASGEYYYNAVLWAVEKGITNGTTATTFSPNATVNRGQTVTFLYRYAESPAATGTSSFTDVAADAYYADAVKWAVAEGITNGTSDTTFAPASNCTRGQIVTFLYRQMAE